MSVISCNSIFVAEFLVNHKSRSTSIINIKLTFLRKSNTNNFIHRAVTTLIKSCVIASPCTFYLFTTLVLNCAVCFISIHINYQTHHNYPIFTFSPQCSSSPNDYFTVGIFPSPVATDFWAVIKIQNNPYATFKLGCKKSLCIASCYT